MAIIDFFRKRVSSLHRELRPPLAIELIRGFKNEVAETEGHTLILERLYNLDEETVRKITMFAIKGIAKKQRELAHLSLTNCNDAAITLTTALNWHYSDMLHNVPSILEGTYYHCGQKENTKECLISELLEPLYLLEEGISKDHMLLAFFERYMKINVEDLIKLANKNDTVGIGTN